MINSFVRNLYETSEKIFIRLRLNVILRLEMHLSKTKVFFIETRNAQTFYLNILHACERHIMTFII